MKIVTRTVRWPFKRPFRIAYRTRTHAETVQLDLIDGDRIGRAEVQGVAYLGETAASIQEQIALFERQVDGVLTRERVNAVLPAGGARNALDCALWDMEAKRAGRRVWEEISLESARPLTTALTLGIDSPVAMAAQALEAAWCTLLKLKLGGDGDDLARVQAVRASRPDVRLMVDANQGWTIQQLIELAPPFAALGVELIEQPLPAGRDDGLADIDCPLPLCADESCQTRGSLPALLGKYQFINIKLDKSGGLTEGLALAHAAKQRGLRLMVGCMAGSSLAMAPAFVLGQLCEFADLDGPLLAASDVQHALRYDGNIVMPPEPELWG